MHYLDNAATTAVLPEAAEAAMHAMRTCFGNPSSLHKMGIDASHLLEDSRKTVACALGCLPEETYFTSCGTESTNISLRGAAYLNRHKKGRIITTEIEHAATLNTCKQLAAEGYDVVFLQPDETGHITPAALEEALTEDTFLLSCQLVNNEIGTVQPVAALGAMLKAKAPRALFHIDAVQGLARVKLTPKKWNCDLMSVSGHKIGAPKGIGALYVKKGTRIDPIIYGGAQQNGLRPGTESLPLACGMGYAAKLRAETIRQDWETVTRLQAYAREKLSAIPGIVLNSPENAFPYILNFSAEGIRSETMLHHLEQYGIYVSNASACGKGAASHVLDAMGLSHRRIDSAIRLSFNAQNTEADIDAFLEKLRLGLDTLARARS